MDFRLTLFLRTRKPQKTDWLYVAIYLKKIQKCNHIYFCHTYFHLKNKNGYNGAKLVITSTITSCSGPPIISSIDVRTWNICFSKLLRVVYKAFFLSIVVKMIFNMVNSLQCTWDYIQVVLIFNAILTIMYAVNINVFQIIFLFKCKCCQLKLVVVLMYGW